MPSDVELVRAEVLNENRTKFNLESLAQVEAEVDKYRQLYNDARSRLTILSGDFEHAKLEHQDEIDQLNYRFKVISNLRAGNVENELKVPAEREKFRLNTHTKNKFVRFFN